MDTPASAPDRGEVYDAADAPVEPPAPAVPADAAGVDTDGFVAL